MNLGKISESILKQSVLKYTKLNLNKKEIGADVVDDCAFLSCSNEKMISDQYHCVVCSMSLPISEDLLMKHVLLGGINQMFVDGFEPTGALFAITLPQRTRQAKLTNMMKLASSVCEEFEISILGGHTEVSDSVINAVVSVTVLGKKIDSKMNQADTSSAQDHHKKGKEKKNEVIDLVVTKYIGLEAAALIATKYETELLKRFPKALVEEAKGYEKYLSVLPEAATAMKSGVCMMQTIREGGIFAALWSMSQKTGTGLTVDLKKIPVKQSVIEICNYYDLNPYEILSTGCLLIAIKDGESFVAKLKEQGINASVIGRLENGNDKTIINGEEKRFLDKPKPDQIRSLLNQEEIAKRREE